MLQQQLLAGRGVWPSDGLPDIPPKTPSSCTSSHKVPWKKMSSEFIQRCSQFAINLFWNNLIFLSCIEGRKNASPLPPPAPPCPPPLPHFFLNTITITPVTRPFSVLDGNRPQTRPASQVLWLIIIFFALRDFFMITQQAVL